MNFIDISIPIKHGMMVYPGDPEPVISLVKDMEGDDDYNISKIDTCLHAGTHIDVPSHIVPNGETIGRVELERFCGKCRVLDKHDIPVIKAADLEVHELEKGDRILFKTRNSGFLNRGEFTKDYTYIDATGANYLKNAGISLVGIDYLSVESFYSTDFKTHRILLENNIIILESINLFHVEAGEYFLFAAPINVFDSEGAPARAILMNLPNM